jgi:Sugar kinases, ribokinase family
MIPLNSLAPSNPKGKILALGELLVDFVPSRIEMKLSDSGEIVKTASGSSGIFACAASNFSNNAGFIGKIGKDSLSRLVYDIIKLQGVDVSRIVISEEGQIGLAFIEYTESGRNYQFYRSNSAGSKLSPADLDVQYIAEAFVLHYSGMLLELSPEMQASCIRAVEIARKNGVLVSFDPNIRKELIKSSSAIQLLKNSIACADIISPTLEEAEFITNEIGVENVLKALHAMGPVVVALTCDKNGAVLSCDDEIIYESGIDVDAVDPTGAGDTFAAALVCGIQMGFPLKKLAQFCNCAGTLTTIKRGAIGMALPTLQEVEEMMSRINEEKSLQTMISSVS